MLEVEELPEITKELVEQYLELLKHGADKLDIQEMYHASSNLGYKAIHLFLARCTLLGGLEPYYHLVKNIEYYKNKYQLGE